MSATKLVISRQLNTTTIEVFSNTGNEMSVHPIFSNVSSIFVFACSVFIFLVDDNDFFFECRRGDLFMDNFLHHATL